MRRQNNSIMGLLLSLAVTLEAGCATEPPPRPAQLDPSNPSAPESAPLTAGQLAEPSSPANPPPPAPAAPAKAEASPDGGGAAKPSGVLYTCPMHPEVISDKPGRCPKCGMNLVPKEPESKR